MRQSLLQIGFVFFCIGFCLYSYLNEQNALTRVKMQLPQKEKELQMIREEMRRLSYQVDQFENPSHLIEIAHRPEFSHLKHPALKEILTVPDEALASCSD